MKILLTGAGGQLGRSVCKRMPSEWDLIALNSSELDITSGPQVDTVFQKHKPVIVINAAAYTAVDLAQSNQKAAKAVNVEGVAHLCKACTQNDAFLIHISTDYVFDGQKNTPYIEKDPLNPLNIYGKTKAEGELTILKSDARSIIIRT